MLANKSNCKVDSGIESFESHQYRNVALTCIFCFISILATSRVAVMMKNNPQLMSHPNKLIFYMCICEGIIAW